MIEFNIFRFRKTLRHRFFEPFYIAIHTALHGIENHVFVRASSMTYTTLLAIVPTFILMHALAGSFQILDLVADALPVLNQHLQLGLPMKEILPILRHAEGLGFTQLGVIGLVSLFVTFVLAIDSLEAHMNATWGISKSRSYLRKAGMALPFLLFAGLAIGLTTLTLSYLQHWLMLIASEGEQIIDGPYWSWFQSGSLFFVMNGFLWLLIFLIYKLVPNTKVHWGKAAWASLVSVLAMRGLIWGFMAIQGLLFQRMSLYYGSLGFIPLIMLSVFGLWSILLFGNTLSWQLHNWPPKARYKRVWRDI